MILLSDASVVIDLWNVDGLNVLTEIAATEILDVVLEECRDPRQPGIESSVARANITVIEYQPKLEAQLPGALSFEDRMNLLYAEENNRVLITTDQALRNASLQRNISVHGSLWVVEQAYFRKVVSPEKLIRWLEVWPTLGSRLPTEEVARIRQLLQGGA